MYLNLAYCNLKLQRYVTCISFCDDVLKLSDDNNICEKCFYRRGESNRCLMHVDRALQDFWAVLKTSPTNKGALDGIVRCKTVQVCINHMCTKAFLFLIVSTCTSPRLSRSKMVQQSMRKYQHIDYCRHYAVITVLNISLRMCHPI